MVDWNNQSTEQLQTDLSGWWDQGPEEPKKAEPAPEPEPPPPAPLSLKKVEPPQAPAPAPLSLRKVEAPKSRIEEEPLHDSWSSAPAGLSIQGKGGDSGSGSTGESFSGLTGNREAALNSSWAAVEEVPEAESWSGASQTTPVKPAWSQPPKPSAPSPAPDQTIAIPSLPQDYSEPEALPPGAPKIGFDSMPESLPVGPPLLPASPTTMPETAISSGGSGGGGGGLFGLAILMLSAVAMIFFGVYHFNGFGLKDGQPRATASPVAEGLKSDSGTWLTSAEDSIKSKEFGLATAQLERAIELLKEEEADAKSLTEVRVKLAGMYFKAKEFEKCRELWLELAKSNKDLRKKGKKAASAASRELRILANGKLKEAEKNLKSRPKMAVSLATEAVELYTRFEGARPRIARAHGVIGDAYRIDRKNLMAAKHYKLAHQYDPQGRYRSELSRLKPVRRPRNKKVVKPVKRPSFVPQDSFPKGR